MTLTRLTEKLASRKLDAVLITNPVNVRYLSEYFRAVGAILLCGGRAYLLTDPVHQREIEENVNGFEIVEVQQNLLTTLRKLLPENKLSRIGFESGSVTHDFFSQLNQNIFNTEWVPLNGEVEQLRRIKRPDEIEQLRRNLHIASECFNTALDSLRPGFLEREFAARLEYEMKLAGAECPAFETIVAAGERSSFPHARASGRSISEGEPIVIDYGMVRGGYCTDTTRTHWLGIPKQEVAELAQFLQEVQTEVLGFIKPGLRGGEVHLRFTELLAERGLEDRCPHALGHGIGLEVHEGPYLMRGGMDVLEAGMVLTLEPGVYLPEQYGVRVEDMILVTEGGATWLRDPS